MSATIKKVLFGWAAAGLVLAGLTTQALAANPAPVQTFYVPFPESQLLTGLQAIESGGSGAAPVNPMTTYISISAAAAGTIVYYDQWENGYDPDIANPLNLYSAGNLGGTQVWGDGDTSNGAPPGVPSDIIAAGTVIILNNTVNTTSPLTIDFDGRDKIAATKNIAVTRTGWASGSGTLLAGSVEVLATENWGTDYRAPVGTDILDGTDRQMFEYTSLAIMAGAGGAVVQIDKDANGAFETTTTLTEGQSFFVDGGVRVGGRVTSDKPVQVDILTGDIGSSYESRDSSLLPVASWASSYFTPVSTASPYGTTVWLYNPGANNLTVQYQTRNGSGNLTTTALTVPGGPAGGYLKQAIPDGYGARFYTAGATFYAFSTTDSTDSSADNNQSYDWGYTLVPGSTLEPQILVGLGLGRDPTSGSSLTQNGNPVWVTPVGNGNTAVNVYVDYDANPATGALIDSNGNKYDVLLSLRELDRAKVYDTTDRNQTGMLVYTLAAGVKLAAAWGQDPSTASAGAPGLDVGTGIPPLPLFSVSKAAELSADNDGNGLIGPGDAILYTITMNNISRAPVPDLVLVDNLPADTTYVPGTTFFKNALGVTTQIPDDAVGTPFPLDGSGRTVNTGSPLPPGGSYQVTLKVTINPNPASTEIVNSGTTTALGITLPFEARLSMLGLIGDFVWNDTNKNGIQDDGTAAVLQNVTVRLYTSAGGLVGTTFTDETGYYSFSSIAPGSYYVEFVLPDATYEFTLRDQGVNDGLDSDADPVTGRTAVFAMAAGQVNLTLDAGMMIKTTLATVIGFDAAPREDGSVAVQWQTSMEKGTLGYYVERLDETSGAYVRVNAVMVPAKILVQGVRSYEVVDAGAVAGGTYTYRLVELETTGRLSTYGPYVVTVGGGTAVGSSGTGGSGSSEAPVVSTSGAPEAPALDTPAVPVISALTAGTGHMVLRWTSAAGQTFRLERSSDLKTFETVAAGIPATPPENITVVVDGAQAGFYRVTAE
jgi:uncharacterized repeat protein (TIGR01451 family)